MERKRLSAFTAPSEEPQEQSDDKKEIKKPRDYSRRARGDCETTTSSHTHYFKKELIRGPFQRVTREEFDGETESISTSESFHCIHGPQGKQYTEKGLLKRNILKELDPKPEERAWIKECPPALGWEMADKLGYLLQDPVGALQYHRIEEHIRDFCTTCTDGYRISVLDTVCLILDYLERHMKEHANFKECFECMLENMSQPIRLCLATDILTHFDKLRNFIGYTGYLLMQLEDEAHWGLVSRGVLWQLSAGTAARGKNAAQRRATLLAAAPVLCQVVARMIAAADSHRFPTFLKMALLLASDSADNCIELIKENILENLFYRFNPYFPGRPLPQHDDDPADPEDMNVRLGDSSVHLTTTFTLMFVLLKTLKDHLGKYPEDKPDMPCPNNYSQRCLIWAYRYECRAREHRQQRLTMTTLLQVLLHCFGDQLVAFSTQLMPDVMSLSVQTEVPLRHNWTREVSFNSKQVDVQFKKTLIALSVHFLHTFPRNIFMVESQYWLLGLMDLLDPGLGVLCVRWSAPLFAEIRKICLQALVCTVQMMPFRLVKEYALIRRLLWYIEWYNTNPYELSVLYWCTRVLVAAVFPRRDPARPALLQDLFDSHAIIILMNLCYTLVEQKQPPVEKSQAIISLCLRLLTSSVELRQRVTCLVYPQIKWPSTVNSLARKMLDDVLYSLSNNFIVGNRWLISLLNFIWEAIIWRDDYRTIFIANNGIYKLLDLITLVAPEVQCVALAVIADVARAGDAVGQLVTWRALAAASAANPVLVKRGASIASLLAAVFRDACRASGVRQQENGTILREKYPLMSAEARRQMASEDSLQDKNQRTTVCYAASDLAGSRMSKVFALLHLLTEDLAYKVSLVDEAYNLYKNIQLSEDDEVMLVLVSHYLTLKLCEAWAEVERQCRPLPPDQDLLREYTDVSWGWVIEIERQQKAVSVKHHKKASAEESSLYEFLGRVRLTVALDALREVRCQQLSSDRAHLVHSLLHDVVHAHLRRVSTEHAMQAPIIKTYGVTLDEQNRVGQNVKVVTLGRQLARGRGQPRESSSYSGWCAIKKPTM